LKRRITNACIKKSGGQAKWKRLGKSKQDKCINQGYAQDKIKKIII